MLNDLQRLACRPEFIGFLGSIAAIEFVRGALFIVLLPIYLPQHLGFPVWAVGVVLSSQYATDLLLKMWVGAYADRNGAWPVLLPGFVLVAAALWLLPYARTLPAVMAISVLFGAGTAGVWPAVVTGTTKLAPTAARTTALSSVFMAWLGGGGLGPVLANFVPPAHQTAAFRVLGIIAVVPIALACLFVWSGRVATARTRINSSLGPRALVGHIRRLAPLLVGMFVPTTAMGMLMPVMVPFAYQHFGLTRPQLALSLVVGGGVAVLALLPAGWLVDRIGFRAPLVGGFALAAAGLALVVKQRGIVHALPFIVLLGVAYALILPAWNGLVAASVPEENRGSMMGFVMTIEGLGLAVGPTVGGVLVSGLGGAIWAFYGAAAVFTAMACLYVWMPIGRFTTF